MKQVFVARTPTEAHLVKGVLETRGIRAEVRGEALWGTRGEIPLTPDTLPTVWVLDDLQAPEAVRVVDPPLAEPLSRGVVFIHYRTENLLLVPVFGPKALEVSPPIGHLHVALDGASWGWGNTSGEPLIIFGLPAGPHKLEITLVNPNHQPWVEPSWNL